MSAQFKVEYLQINTSIPQNGYIWDVIHLNRASSEALAKAIQAYLIGEETGRPTV